VRLEILVSPRASRAKLGPMHDGRLTSPPVDGEANAAVIEVLAKALGIPKSRIAIVAGATGRRKTVELAGVSDAALAAVLAGVT